MSSDNALYPEEHAAEHLSTAHAAEQHRWNLESRTVLHEDEQHAYVYSARTQKIYPPRLWRSSLWSPSVLLALLIFIGGTLFGVALMALAPALRTLALPQVGQAPVNTAAQGTPLLSLPVAKDVTLLSIHDLVAGTLYVQTGDASTVTLSASTSAAPSVQSSQQGDTLTLSLAGQVSDDFTLVLPPQVSLDLQTTSAAIVFTGTLLPQNTYQFASETGSISLSLPANSAFRLGNIVDVGDFTNDFGTDVVGSGPRSTLIILAYDGSVAIQKH